MTPPPSPGTCVLIVDDRSDLRLSFRTVLHALGYSVLEAADGRAALDQLDGRLPDIILTDIAMPGMDGIDLARSLRGAARTATIPIIAITGVAHEKLGEPAVRELFDHVLRKPVFPHELVSTVGEVGGVFGRGPAPEWSSPSADANSSSVAGTGARRDPGAKR